MPIRRWPSCAPGRRPEAVGLEELDEGDPRLAPYRDLKDSSLRRLVEPAEGLFVVEGRFALEALLCSPYPLLSVLVLAGHERALEGLSLPVRVPVYVTGRQVMAATAGYDVHRGLLALAGRLPEEPGLGLVDRLGPRLVVVAEGLTDQENLGAVFRNAAAFGAGAVLLGPTCADPLYRRTVRVSLGHVLRAPFGRLSPWPEALGLLAQRGYRLLALTPRPGAASLGPVAAALQEAKVAVVAGAEGAGLPDEVVALCQAVRVPMAPGVDSLNVAVATAVALYALSGLR